MLQPLHQDILDLLVVIQLKYYPKESKSIFASVMYISKIHTYEPGLL